MGIYGFIITAIPIEIWNGLMIALYHKEDFILRKIVFIFVGLILMFWHRETYITQKETD